MGEGKDAHMQASTSRGVESGRLPSTPTAGCTGTISNWDLRSASCVLSASCTRLPSCSVAYH